MIDIFNAEYVNPADCTDAQLDAAFRAYSSAVPIDRVEPFLAFFEPGVTYCRRRPERSVPQHRQGASV